MGKNTIQQVTNQDYANYKRVARQLLICDIQHVARNEEIDIEDVDIESLTTYVDNNMRPANFYKQIENLIKEYLENNR